MIILGVQEKDHYSWAKASSDQILDFVQRSISAKHQTVNPNMEAAVHPTIPWNKSDHTSEVVTYAHV